MEWSQISIQYSWTEGKKVYPTWYTVEASCLGAIDGKIKINKVFPENIKTMKGLVYPGLEKQNCWKYQNQELKNQQIH